MAKFAASHHHRRPNRARFELSVYAPHAIHRVLACNVAIGFTPLILGFCTPLALAHGFMFAVAALGLSNSFGRRS